MFGIDISQHNGSIDWNKLKNSVDFVILRVGWTGNKNNHTIDKKFEQYYREATRVGIPIGVYIYIYNNNVNSAKSGAEWTVKQLQGKKIQMPVYADMEDSSIADLGKSTLTAITKAFNDVIESNGYKAGVYANANWFNNYLDKSIQNRYTCWIAHYTSGTDKYKGEFDMWQNSSNGNVSGISGRVDTNYLYNTSIIKGTDGWQMDDDGWYYLKDGSMVKNQWVQDSNGWLYLNEKGRIATNKWQKDTVGWLYLGEDGHPIINQWKQDSVGWCYVDGDGYAKTNAWQQDSQGWCFIKDDGHLLYDGYAWDGSGKHYLDDSGHMVW